MSATNVQITTPFSGDIYVDGQRRAKGPEATCRLRDGALLSMNVGDAGYLHYTYRAADGDELTFEKSREEGRYYVDGRPFGVRLDDGDEIPETLEGHPVEHVNFQRTATEDDFRALGRLADLRALRLSVAT